MMGYLPPKPPEHTHEATMYTIARIYDVGNQLLAAYSGTPRLTGYQRYIQDLYGWRTAGWFPVLNYALLGAMFAAAAVLVWVVVR